MSESAVQIRILSMAARNGGAEILLRVGLSDPENDACSEVRELLLLSDCYMELRPSKGEIDPEFFELLEDAAAFSTAVRMGLRMLAFGGNTRRSLESKLIQKGAEREAAKRAVAYLAEHGYLSETEDAVREAERNVARLRGRNRIRAALSAKGYGSDAMAAAERYLDGVDFPELCLRLIERRYAAQLADPSLHKKLAATLMRNGFTMSEIRAAFRMASA